MGVNIRKFLRKYTWMFLALRQESTKAEHAIKLRPWNLITLSRGEI